MEKSIITSGKTIDLAIESALSQLGLDRDSVSVTVLQQAKSVFLGFGAQSAKVQVSYEVPDPVPEKEEKPIHRDIRGIIHIMTFMDWFCWEFLAVSLS